MRHYLAFAAVTILCSTIASAQTPAIPPLYVPVGVFYQNGKLANVIAYPNHTYDSLKECAEALQHALLDMQENGKVPSGGFAMGACLPVPSVAAASI